MSVALVTKDGGRDVRALVEALARQRIDCQVEIVAVDSGSRDGTAEWLEASPHVSTVVRIVAEDFNHGATRNLAIASSRGAFVVLIVQDALPTSDDWLHQLVAPLRRDAGLAGTFCRQRPRPDAHAVTKHYLEGWMGSRNENRRVSLASPGDLTSLSPAERLSLCTFDNVCSCVRRSAWLQVPFARTTIAEDVEWARDALSAGWALQYVAGAEVVHSHDRTASYELARTYLLHHRLAELLGLRTIPGLGGLLSAVASSIRLHLRLERDARRTGARRAGVWRAMTLAFAWPLGQYLGGVSAARGWTPRRWRDV